MLEDIDSFGWQVVKVCGEFPEWAYSVGLFQAFQHPEIVIFGLPPDLMHSLINDIGAGIRKRGSITLGQRCDAYLEGVDVEFRPVDSRWAPPLLGQACWYYGNDDFPAIQCCWPDMENNLPWDSGYNQQLNDRQPLLFQPTAKAAHLSSILADMNQSGSDE